MLQQVQFAIRYYARGIKIVSSHTTVPHLLMIENVES